MPKKKGLIRLRWVLEHRFAWPAHATVDARGANSAHVQLKRQLATATCHIENTATTVQLLDAVLLQDPLFARVRQHERSMMIKRRVRPARGQRRWRSCVPEAKAAKSRHGARQHERAARSRQHERDVWPAHLAVRVGAVGGNGGAHAAARDFLRHPLRFHGQVSSSIGVEEAAERAGATAAAVHKVLTHAVYYAGGGGGGGCRGSGCFPRDACHSGAGNRRAQHGPFRL